MSRKRKIKVSIGVFCHNEENNVARALSALLTSRTSVAEIIEILVVSSGSFDKTNRIVRGFAKKDKRIKLIDEAERRGKSAAVNLFLMRARGEVMVSLSGDVRPKSDAIEEMALLFLNLDVGMVGSHPIPTNCRFSQVGKEMGLLWELHHKVSLIRPKCGEMIAFRNVIRRIPLRPLVDEATLEVLLKLIGFSVVYAPRAIVYNKVPKTLSDYVVQRRRNHAAHLLLADKYQYQVSTTQQNILVKVLLDYIMENPSQLVVIMRLLLIEGLSQFLGWFDYSVMGRNPYTWRMVKR